MQIVIARIVGREVLYMCTRKHRGCYARSRNLGGVKWLCLLCVKFTYWDRLAPGFDLTTQSEIIRQSRKIKEQVQHQTALLPKPVLKSSGLKPFGCVDIVFFPDIIINDHCRAVNVVCQKSWAWRDAKTEGKHKFFMIFRQPPHKLLIEQLNSQILSELWTSTYPLIHN